MNDEQEWVRTCLRDSEALDHARRIQPGRGHRYCYEQDSDWWVLVLILVFIAAGIFG